MPTETQAPALDPLAVGLREARHTPAAAFAPLLEAHRSLRSADGSLVVRQDAQLAELLASYRRRFQEQILYDFDYNIQRLQRWAEQMPPSHGVLDDAQIQDGFRQLGSVRRFFAHNDQWAGHLELTCFGAFQQFYCDALALGDRLFRYHTGQRPRRQTAKRLKRLRVAEAASSYRLAQAVVNAAEMAFPNVFCIRPLHSLLPAAWYSGSRAILPWLAFRWPVFLRKLHGLLTSGIINSLVERSGSVVECCGKDDLFSEFYDPVTGRTRHNLIIALSHRHSMLDLPFGAEALVGIDHAMWVNELYYPQSAASDPRLVVVCSTRRRRMEPVVRKSADLMLNAGIPVAIVVDGGGGYLPYGQQMSLKRGIRSLVDHMNAVTKGSKRRTFIVPLSLNDPMGLIAGLDSKVRLTFHRPICTDDIAPAPSRPDRKAIHRGDPLLVYLESFFLANTGQVRHGWRTPRVTETVRRVAQQRRRSIGIGNWIRSRCHASLYDLSRDQSTADVDSIGP